MLLPAKNKGNSLTLSHVQYTLVTRVEFQKKSFLLFNMVLLPRPLQGLKRLACSFYGFFCGATHEEDLWQVSIHTYKAHTNFTSLETNLLASP